MDWGYGRSHPAAHLHVVLGDGTFVTVAEFVVPHLSAVEFAQEVVRRFIEPETGGHRRKIIAAFLDPSAFNESGIDATISIATQINSVLTPWETSASKAANDRVGGWQTMYAALQAGKWKIADTCPLTIEAIQTRIHDEKKTGDIKKVPGDRLDDVADSCRYGIFSWLDAAEPPIEVRRAELASQFSEQINDPSASWAERSAAATSLMVRHAQLQAEQNAPPVR
jgi:hypothetical protein